METLPWWGISSMPGPTPPPREHKHERRYTPGTHSVIPTRGIWNDDYGGQIIFGELCAPKVSWHLSYRWGKSPKKNFTQENCPDRGSNSGPLSDRLACYCLFHSGKYTNNERTSLNYINVHLNVASFYKIIKTAILKIFMFITDTSYMGTFH